MRNYRKNRTIERDRDRFIYFLAITSMNYLILKNIIDATIAHFRCQNCKGQINENNVNLLGSNTQGINLEIICPHCATIGIVKAEVNMLAANMIQSEHGKAFLQEMMQKVGTGEGILIHNKDEGAPMIKDEDILKVRDTLKKGNTMEDLFL